MQPAALVTASGYAPLAPIAPPYTPTLPDPSYPCWPFGAPLSPNMAGARAAALTDAGAALWPSQLLPAAPAMSDEGGRPQHTPSRPRDSKHARGAQPSPNAALDGSMLTAEGLQAQPVLASAAVPLAQTPLAQRPGQGRRASSDRCHPDRDASPLGQGTYHKDGILYNSNGADMLALAGTNDGFREELLALAESERQCTPTPSPDKSPSTTLAKALWPSSTVHPALPGHSITAVPRCSDPALVPPPDPSSLAAFPPLPPSPSHDAGSSTQKSTLTPILEGMQIDPSSAAHGAAPPTPTEIAPEMMDQTAADGSAAHDGPPPALDNHDTEPMDHTGANGCALMWVLHLLAARCLCPAPPHAITALPAVR